MKDCKFTVTIDGKKVVYDYDGFRYFLMDNKNLASVAPSFGMRSKPRNTSLPTEKKDEPKAQSAPQGVSQIKPPITLPLNKYDNFDEPVKIYPETLPVVKAGRFAKGTEAAEYIANLGEQYKDKRKQILQEMGEAWENVEAIESDPTASAKDKNIALASKYLSCHKMNSLEAEMKVEALSALSQGGLTQLNYSVRHDPAARNVIYKYPEADEYVKKGVELFRRIVGNVKGLSSNQIDIVLFEGRSYFASGENAMYVNVSDGSGIVSIVAHEAGHWLEHNAPGVLDKSRAFLMRRTKDEPLRRLKDINPSVNFNDTEYAKPDEFYSMYMGKYYPANDSSLKNIPNFTEAQLKDDAIWKSIRSTELISVGIELFIRDPIEFAQKDPDTFAFIYDVLKGLH